MKEYEEYLSDKKRAQSLYTNSILRLFMEAREYYNDEDNGIVRIKQSLSKFKPKQQNTAEKRALSVEEIRKIFALPYDNKDYRGRNSRHDLALDCFRLSFCLMGMNSADLYNATEFDGEYITYYRTKTKERRMTMLRWLFACIHWFNRLLTSTEGETMCLTSMNDFLQWATLIVPLTLG